MLGTDRLLAAVRLLHQPEARQLASHQAALLSRARLLYAVLAPHRFGDRFFVPLAGVTDDNGQSPFWDALGRKFFKMDFLEAERIIGGARNRTLIVELMPHYPVYVPLLPGPAQAAMGQIHPSGELAFDLLTEEGFEADEYIDIFDGGPILQSHKHALRSFSGSLVRRVADQGQAGSATDSLVTYAVAGSERKFRAVVVACAPADSAEAICLPAWAQDALRGRRAIPSSACASKGATHARNPCNHAGRRRRLDRHGAPGRLRHDDLEARPRHARKRVRIALCLFAETIAPEECDYMFVMETPPRELRGPRLRHQGRGRPDRASTTIEIRRLVDRVASRCVHRDPDAAPVESTPPVD